MRSIISLKQLRYLKVIKSFIFHTTEYEEILL
jgi:hypothetical protein